MPHGYSVVSCRGDFVLSRAEVYRPHGDRKLQGLVLQCFMQFRQAGAQLVGLLQIASLVLRVTTMRLHSTVCSCGTMCQSRTEECVDAHNRGGVPPVASECEDQNLAASG